LSKIGVGGRLFKEVDSEQGSGESGGNTLSKIGVGYSRRSIQSKAAGKAAENCHL